MTANPPSADFVASYIADMIGNAELTAGSFTSLAVDVATDVAALLIPRREAIDCLQDRAEAAGLAESKGVDWIQRILELTFGQIAPAQKDEARPLDDARRLSISAQAAIEVRAERALAERAGLGETKKNAGAPRFKLARFDEITPDAGAGYLVKGLLPSAGLVVIWGAPKCGKSFWTFDVLMHAALAWEYRGRRVKPGPIVYCALEGAQGFKNRVEAFRQARLAENTDASPPFYLMSSPLSLVRDQAAFVAAISMQLGDAKPVAVCIDTLNRSIAGSENDDADMGAYVRAADAIREAFDCLVVIVHHSGYSAERPRGHSSLVGALDVQISIKRDAAGNVVAELELAKDGATGLQLVSRLNVVEIGRDDDGDPITSCVVEAADSPSPDRQARPSARLSKGAQIALRALRDAIDECGAEPPASNHIPTGVKAVTVEQWRTYAYWLGVSGSSEARARQLAFQRAHEALIAAGQVAVWEPMAWIV